MISVRQSSASRKKWAVNWRVHGSISLTKWLLEEGLVDEFCLLIYPVMKENGGRLFDDVPQVEFVLESSDATNNGVLALVYRPKSERGSTPPNQSAYINIRFADRDSRLELDDGAVFCLLFTKRAEGIHPSVG